MKNQLTTKRLRLIPMMQEELKRRVAEEADAGRRTALERMQLGARGPGAHWHTVWRIELRKTGERVGEAYFLSAPLERTVSLNFSIDEARRGQGYAQEALQALCNWAFSRGAYYVAAEAAPNDAASQRALESCGFRCLGTGQAEDRWEKEKPKSSWLAAYLCLGLAVGCCLGATFGRAMPGAGVSFGMGLGFAAGVALGTVLDRRDRRARQRSATVQEGEIAALFAERREEPARAALADPIKEQRQSSTARYMPANGKDAAAKEPPPGDDGGTPEEQIDAGTKTIKPKQDGQKKKAPAKEGAASKAAEEPPTPEAAQGIDTPKAEAPAKDEAAEGEPKEPDDTKEKEPPKAEAPKKKPDKAAKDAAAEPSPATKAPPRSKAPAKDEAAEGEPKGAADIQEKKPPKAEAPKKKPDKAAKDAAAEPSPSPKAPPKTKAPAKDEAAEGEPKQADTIIKNGPKPADKQEQEPPPESGGE